VLPVSTHGRDEAVLGRRVVKSLIRDTTAGSVAEIAEFAVKEVTHSPEVAECGHRNRRDPGGSREQ
jgi:hypothetical protein